MSLSEEEARAIVSGRMKFKQPEVPYRGAPIQLHRKPGPRKGYWDDRANLGAIKIALPPTKSGIRAAVSRLRG